MSYSDIYINRDKKIPTILAILIVCFVGLFMLRLIGSNAIPSKAEKKVVRRVEITNLSSNQVSIFWETSEKTIGWVLYGDKESTPNKLAYDDRDLSKNKLKYTIHYVTLKGLEENKTYYFKLVNNNKMEDNANLPARFTTRKNTKDYQVKNPAYGKIIEANGASLENIVLLLYASNTFPLSTLSKSTGEWLIPLSSLYDKTTGEPMNPAPNEKITIEAIGELKNSQVITDLSKISPLPQTIIIGQNFNFTTSSDNVLSATSSNEVPAQKEIDILYPKENAVIPGLNPLIKGVAIPNSQVLITIHSDKTITSRVKTDSKGIWVFTLPSSLSPGAHTILVEATDKNGNKVSVERKFTIAKNGEQVLGSATPEATITEEPIMPTPTVIAYNNPTRALTPTPPVSGGNVFVPFAAAFSFIVFGLGLLLVF